MTIKKKSGTLFSLKISGGRRLAVMKKMKYFFMIILGIALLTGCGSDSGQRVQTASQTEIENKSEKEETVMQTSEKVGSLGTTLPGSNSQMTTQAGDIVLYNNSQIVIFYGSNSWSYTKLGHVDDLTGWEEALGSGDVTVTFSIQ